MQAGALDASDLRVDLTSPEHVRWLNDLESGRQYARWDRSLMGILRPQMFGGLPRVARNLYNFIFLIDPGTLDGCRSAARAVPAISIMLAYWEEFW